MSTWSGIRAKLEQEHLAPALQGRIQYFVTSYSKCPDHEGRAAVRMDEKEILKSSYYEYCLAEWSARKEIDNQNIKMSLVSSNPIVRMFALLDKRVGKRTLISLRDTMKSELVWLHRFYHLRCDAENMDMEDIT